MDNHHEPNFYYLNREGAWLDFKSTALDLRPDGAWQLAALPRLAAQLPEDIEQLPVPSGPAGLAADPCGAIYYSHPESARLGEIEPCEGNPLPADCLPGEGHLPGWLDHPRGLLYHPIREALFLADSGNNRIQIFDPRTWQVMDIWGRSGSPGAWPWTLDTPWSLAADPQGNVYVVDVPEAGTARVVKFDLYGRPEQSFWDTASQSAGVQRPVAVAAGCFAGEDCIYVLDEGRKEVIVLRADGRYLTSFGSTVLQQPLVLAADGDVVYVGDNMLRQVLVFKPAAPQSSEFAYAGPALGYQGPVAALTPGRNGNLWLHPGWQRPPLRLEMAGAYARNGLLWGGPFGPGRGVRWHRLKTAMESLGAGAHAQFFVFGSNDLGDSPGDPDASSEAPFTSEAGWRALPLDATDALIPQPMPIEPARSTLPPAPKLSELAKEINAVPKEAYLWIGALLTGDGRSSPLLRQARLDYDHTSYRQHLPAIFSRDAEQAALLDRLLSLLESFYEEAEDGIRYLDHLFDPAAAPAGWLSWLAGWVGLDLLETWPEATQREAIASALASYARRGTASGLREAIQLYAGVNAHIDEPILGSDWWALSPADEDDLAGQAVSVLGFTTRLAPSEPEGAVLGGSAVLDGSSLIGAEDYGAPLFEEVAHQFTIQVYRGQVRTEQELERVRATIEREKPAHTVYHLCVIEPKMRVGFQARLGIDTVVAGPLQPSRLDGGDGLVLGGDVPGQIGVQSQVGRTTRLTNHSLQ